MNALSTRVSFFAGAVVCCFASAHCGDDFEQSATSASSTSATGPGTGGEGGTVPITSSGGSGGGGGEGGGPACRSGDTQGCYSGDPGTQDKGLCKAGTQTCDDMGTWGECTNEILPDTEICTVADDEDCDGLSCSEPIWARIFGTTLAQIGTGLGVDAQGRVAVSGIYESTIDFGGQPLAGPAGAFVAQLDADGQHLWSVGAPGSVEGFVPLAVDAQGAIVVAGAFDGTITFPGGPAMTAQTSAFFVVKLDAAGNHVWSKSFQATQNATPWDIAVTSGGDAIVVGKFSGDVAFDAPGFTARGDDAFVLRLAAADGKVVYGKQFGEKTFQAVGGDQILFGVDVDPNDNVVAAGRFGSSVDLGPGPGSSELLSNDLNDVWVMALDSMGTRLWADHFQGNDAQTVTGIAAGPGGEVFVAGFFSGQTAFTDHTGFFTTKNTTGPADLDIFLTKLAADGSHVWTKTFGDATDQATNGPFLQVAVDPGGNVAFSGGYNGTVDLGGGPMPSAGEIDTFLAKLDGTGLHLWSRQYGDAATYQTSLALDIDPLTRALVFTAANDGTMTFDQQLTSAGGMDVVVAKIAP